MEVGRFADIEAGFAARVSEMVWCSMATVDRSGRPCSRIIHPVWEGSKGWILTHRDSHKSRHLENNPFVSLAYVRGDVQRPVYADCRATWVDEPEEKDRVWQWVRSTPEPLGFDPALDFGSSTNAEFGLLKLSPWRIVLVTFPAESIDAGQRVWRDESVLA